MNLSRYDLKIIENYVIEVGRLKLRLRVREQELLNEGIIFPQVDSYYQKLHKLINAIEDVYDNLGEDVKMIWKLKYHEPELRLGTWEELAKEFSYTKTTLLRVRSRYLSDIAERIGYVSADLVEGENESNVKEKRNVSTRKRFEVLKRDAFKCQYCGRNPREDDIKLHVDHIKPLAKGGDNEMSNLITSCVECNAGKSDKEI